MIATLLLAAGASSRMRGGDKLLEPVGGVPLLRRQAMAASAVTPTVVTLPPDRAARRDALRGLEVTCIEVPDAEDGMSASIRAGVAALPPALEVEVKVKAVIVLPADMPEIDAGAIRALVGAAQAQPGAVIRGATQDGRPGHPVLFPRRLFATLAALSGDQGARAVLAEETPLLVPLPGEAALVDLDTPEAWAAWRARANGGP